MQSEWVAEVLAGARGAVVVQVVGSSVSVGMSDSIVTTGHIVGGGSSSLPGELRCGGVPGVRDYSTGAFSRVVQAPGAINRQY